MATVITSGQYENSYEQSPQQYSVLWDGGMVYQINRYENNFLQIRTYNKEEGWLPMAIQNIPAWVLERIIAHLMMRMDSHGMSEEEE